MKVDNEKMTAEIELMKNNTVYIVKEGKVIEQVLPDHGEAKITTHNGKPKFIELYTKIQL